jgi:hypothetical protein
MQPRQANTDPKPLPIVQNEEIPDFSFQIADFTL